MLLSTTELREVYPEITQYMLQHFSFFWTVLIGVFTILGVAIYFVCRGMAQEGVDKAISSITSSIQQVTERVHRLEIIKEQNHPLPHELPVLDGFERVPHFSCEYSKDQNDFVVLQIAVQAKDTFLPSGDSMFAILPEGFRPIQNIGLTLSATVEIEVRTDGYISYSSNTQLPRLLVSSISFYAR